MPQRAQAPDRRRSPAIDKPGGVPKRRAASRSAARKNGAGTPAASPDDVARREMIAVAAYFRAQRRGFSPGDPLEDWVQAEAEITRMFPQ